MSTRKEARQQITIDALMEIAQGHLRNGSPLPREASRQIARRALIRIRERWGTRQTEKSEAKEGAQQWSTT